MLCAGIDIYSYSYQCVQADDQASEPQAEPEKSSDEGGNERPPINQIVEVEA